MAVGPPFVPRTKEKGEVVRVWKKRVLKGIWFLIGVGFFLYLSTMNAC